MGSVEPKCKKCGGQNFAADYGGYYEDAENASGQPLVCLDCHGIKQSRSAAPHESKEG